MPGPGEILISDGTYVPRFRQFFSWAVSLENLFWVLPPVVYFFI